MLEAGRLAANDRTATRAVVTPASCATAFLYLSRPDSSWSCPFLSSADSYVLGGGRSAGIGVRRTSAAKGGAHVVSLKDSSCIRLAMTGVKE
jgi:hypothetical protein